MKPWSPTSPASPVTPRRPACPHRRLARLLVRELPPELMLGESRLHSWASANFVGARHIFPCTVAGSEIPPRRALQRRLIAANWSLAGHIVADVAVENEGDGGMRIEILTVED
jgi:hypothetical protein